MYLGAHGVWRQLNWIFIPKCHACPPSPPVTVVKYLPPTHRYPAGTVITLAILHGLHFWTAALHVPPWGTGKWFSPFHSPLPSGCGCPCGSWCDRCWELRSKQDHYVEKLKSDPDLSVENIVAVLKMGLNWLKIIMRGQLLSC